MSITYNIVQDQVILFFKDGNKVPFLIQTSWPNGQPWQGPVEPRTWANLKKAEIEDKNAPFAPIAPGENGKVKPTKTQIEDAFNALKEASNSEEYIFAQKTLQDLKF